MEQQIAVLQRIRWLLNRHQRQQSSKPQHQDRRLADPVDSFYPHLGPPNRVFTNDMDVPAMERVVEAPSRVSHLFPFLSHGS